MGGYCNSPVRDKKVHFRGIGKKRRLWESGTMKDIGWLNMRQGQERNRR